MDENLDNNIIRKDYNKNIKNNPVKNKGLIIINTGNGKGKTTAALGCALRSAGHKQKVLILQFIKGNMVTGELKSIKYLKLYIEIFQLGKGFIKYKNGKPFITEKDKLDAKNAYEFSLKKIQSENYDLIILDEIINLLNFNLVSFNEVKKLINCKQQSSSIILTGSNAPEKLISLADTVTEMREIKHAFQKGIMAKNGNNRKKWGKYLKPEIEYGFSFEKK
jgi:cob(I)alamin adenosyltransferase